MKQVYDHIMNLESNEEIAKSIKFLTDFYIKQQFIPPSKCGLLTGNTTKQTYRFTFRLQRFD